MIDLLLSQFRVFIVGVAVVAGLWVLGVRLQKVQMDDQQQYLEELRFSHERKIKVRKPGVRGRILDRNGVELARNKYRYQAALNIRDVYLHWEKLQATTKEVGAERPSIEVLVGDYVLKPLSELMGREVKVSASALKSHFLTHDGLLPFVILDGISFEQFSELSEMSYKVPGLLVQTSNSREYPYGALGCHVLGFTKKWAKGDLSAEERKQYKHFIGDAHGVAGAELSFDELLRGAPSEETFVRVRGGYEKVAARTPSIGEDLQLTLDVDLQYHAESILRQVGRGAMVVMDVRNGEVLAMASTPSYNPNDFVSGVSHAKSRYYYNNLASPFTNRALEGFAPGSTFKVATGMAGVRHGLSDKSFSCNGYVQYNRIKVGCWLYNKYKRSHGLLSLDEALMRSCNPFFNEMANEVDGKRLVDSFEVLGFGQPTKIGLPEEKGGILIGSLSWRRLNLFRSNLTNIDEAMLSFGQGEVLATPLQLAKMTTAVANGEYLLQPKLFQGVKADDDLQERQKLSDLGYSKAGVDKIREGMRRAANEYGGTARSTLQGGSQDFIVAAKTGTAQTADFGKKSNNSLIISFAPFENPRYAVVVAVKAGGSGGRVAGPLVKRMYACLQAWELGALPPAEPLSDYPGHISFINSVEIPFLGTPQEKFLMKSTEEMSPEESSIETQNDN